MLFWDGINEDSKDSAALAKVRQFGFAAVRFESLNGRYSIFDKRHTPEHTLLVGETQRLCEGLLADTAERVLSTLTDAAPALPEKLHAALGALRDRDDQRSNRACGISCRRVIEYVADCLFPPQSQPSPGGRKLDQQAYRNRLLAYADAARASDSSIDLIVASTATLAEQLEKLDSVVNKGIHATLLDAEGRRCVVRTVMLLDDMISLRGGPFEVRPELESMKSFLGRRQSREGRVGEREEAKNPQKGTPLIVGPGACRANRDGRRLGISAGRRRAGRRGVRLRLP